MAAKEKPLVIPVSDMLDALRGVKDGASKTGSSRPHIECVHVCSKSTRKTPKGKSGQLDVVATNGHVLYLWRQRLEKATDRSFSLTNACVKRMVRELTDVKREYDDGLKNWASKNIRRLKDEQLVEPEEPTITFFGNHYEHDLGTMRLDVADVKYPNYAKFFDEFAPRTKKPPPPAGISSKYLAEVCKNFQKVTKNNDVGIRMEFDHWTPGDTDFPMMRFSTPEIRHIVASHLVCLVMPMRI